MPKTKQVKFHPEVLTLKGFKDKALQKPTGTIHKVETESDIAIGEKTLAVLRAIYPTATVKPVNPCTAEVKNEDDTVQYFEINVYGAYHSDSDGYSAFNLDAEGKALNEVELGYMKDGKFHPFATLPYKNFIEDIEHPQHTRWLLSVVEDMAKKVEPEWTNLNFKYILSADLLPSEVAERARDLNILVENQNKELSIFNMVVHYNLKHNPEMVLEYTGEGMTFPDHRVAVDHIAAYYKR